MVAAFSSAVAAPAGGFGTYPSFARIHVVRVDHREDMASRTGCGSLVQTGFASHNRIGTTAVMGTQTGPMQMMGIYIRVRDERVDATFHVSL